MFITPYLEVLVVFARHTHPATLTVPPFALSKLTRVAAY